MNRLLSAALVAAALGLPAAAFAADAMAGSMMMHAAPGTVVCRPAAAGEHGMAMMMSTKSMLVCKPVTAKMMSGPDLSKALSPEQINMAWENYLNTIIAVPVTGGG